MKTKISMLFFLILSLASTFLYAQPPGEDKIIGVWLTTDKKAHIEIFKVEGKYYYGRLIWADELYEADGKTSKKDINNEDVSKRNRSLKNLLLLTGFVYNEGVWEEGKIYDPKNGKTYKCTMKLDNNTLNVRGYIGVSLLGRTETWTRKQ